MANRHRLALFLCGFLLCFRRGASFFWTTIQPRSSVGSSSSLCSLPPPKNTVAPNSRKDFEKYDYDPKKMMEQPQKQQAPQQQRQAPDEYEAIVLYHKGESPIFVQETAMGEAAFAGYRYNQNQNALRCSTIQNIGDVIVAIDGASTQGSTVTEIIQFIQEKARKNSHSFFRLRTKPAMPTGPVTAESGELPGERQRRQLELEISQIKSSIQEREELVEQLQERHADLEQELQEIYDFDLTWIEEQREVLKKMKQAKQNEDNKEDGNDKKKNVRKPKWPSLSKKEQEKTKTTAKVKNSGGKETKKKDKPASPIFNSVAALTKNIMGPTSLPDPPTSQSLDSHTPPPANSKSTNLPQIDLNRCITECQRAINYLYGGTTTTMRRPIQYETLEYLKDVFQKLLEAKRTHISEASMLQEGAGITSENYQEFVTELRMIIDLLVEMRTKEGGYGGTEQLHLELFVQCLTRVFAGQGKQKPTSSSTSPKQQPKQQPYRPKWQ